MDEPMRARYYHRMTQKIPISNLSKTQTIPWKKNFAKNYAQFFAYSHKKEVIHKIKNCSTWRNFALFRQIVLLDINKCTEKIGLISGWPGKPSLMTVSPIPASMTSLNFTFLESLVLVFILIKTLILTDKYGRHSFRSDFLLKFRISSSVDRTFEVISLGDSSLNCFDLQRNDPSPISPQLS